MERLGELLRKAREAQGLSIEDIYRITRVNMPMLRALEGNHLEKLPVPVIARGFIKSYCKAVGINEAKALDIYDQELGPREPELVDRLHIGNSDRSMKWIFILAIIVVVILGIMLFIYSSWKQDGIREWRSSGSGVKKNALPAGHMKKSTMVRRKIFPESPLSAQAQTPMNSQRKLPDTQKIQSIPSTSHPSVLYVKPGSPGLERSSLFNSSSGLDIAEKPAEDKIKKGNNTEQTLELEADELTWLQREIDEGPPSGLVLHPGDKIVIRARKRIKLYIGNAGGVRLTFNGNPIQHLGPSGKAVFISLPSEDEKPRN